MQLETNNGKSGSKFWGRFYNMNNEALLLSFSFLGLTIGGIMEQLNNSLILLYLPIMKTHYLLMIKTLDIS